MKKFLCIMLVLAMCFSFWGCSSESGNTKDSDKKTEEKAENKDVSATVLKTDSITVDAICADDSYRDDDGSSLRLVYLFYTLKANDENLEIDSTYTNMKIGNNEYTSEHIPGVCKFAPNYTYTSYIQDVYVGEELKVVATFKVPEKELEEGKEIALSDNQLPDEENLKFTTDEIQHFDSIEELCKSADPEGYQQVMAMYENADAERVEFVKSLINGYYWSFYLNSTAYKLEFWDPQIFEVTTAFGTNGGTYSIKNGYIICTYDGTGYSVDIPYEIEDGNISLDVGVAFDVNEN